MRGIDVLLMSTRALGLGGVFLILLAGCGSDPAAIAEGTIGPAGGTLRAGGAVLTVPAGALSSTTALTVRCEGSAPAGFASNSALCHFGPDGTRFSLPVTVQLPVTGDTAAAAVWWSRDSGEGYDPLPTTFSEGAATTLVTHFSTGFVGRRSADAGTDAGIDAGIDASIDTTIDATSDASTDTPIDVRTDVPVGTAAAPRVIGPRSGSRAISNRPRVRWALPAGVTTARLIFCRDHALTMGCVDTEVAAEQGQPATALSPGVWFWGLRGVAGGLPGAALSAVWRLTVPSSAGTAQGFSGGDYDANGDGYADLLDPRSLRALTVDVLLGGPGGVSSTRVVRVPQPLTGNVGSNTAGAGDFDGDGYGDLVFLDARGRLLVMRGSASGPVGPIATVVSDLTVPAVAVTTSDLNGDGRDDAIVGSTLWFPGSATGLSAAGSMTGFGEIRLPGDIDGDGFNDLLGRATTGWRLVRGAASMPDFATSMAVGGVPFAAGDSNNDGFADVVVDDVVRYGSAGGLAPASSASPRTGVPTITNSLPRVADVDRDGDDDLLWTAFNTYLVLGDAAGRIETRGATTDLANPVRFAGDLDGDGQIDLWRSDVRSDGPFEFSVFSGPFDLGAVGSAVVRLAPRIDEPQVAVVSVGDANGDGRADLAIGPGPGETTLQFFAGTATGFAAPLAITVPALPAPAHVIAAGDLDRDGLADVVISTGPAAVRVVYGARSNLGGRARDLAAGSATTGLAIPVMLGDVDGDGHRDLVVLPGGDATRVLLYRGTATGPATTATDVTVSFTDTRTWLGRINAVGAAGDLNGDHFNDVVFDIQVAGTFGFNDAYVFYGSATGLTQGPRVGTDAFGYAPSRAPGPLGDIDGDGRSEAMVSGRTYGVEGTTQPDFAGAITVPAGDFDGDGVDDVLLSSSGLQVRAGGAGPLTRVLREWPSGATATARYPQPMTTVPDLDGDHRPEVVATTRFGTELLYSLVPAAQAAWRSLP